MKEKAFENKIKKYLRDRGCYVVKYFGCAFSQSGVPDLLCCINGTFVAIEVKSDTGKPSALQLANIADIQGAGGVAMVLHPKDWDKFTSFIDSLYLHPL